MKTFKINWQLFYVFFVSLFFCLLASALMPAFKINYLAAALAFFILNSSFYGTLWPTFGFCLATDLFSSTILGFHSLVGVISASLLFTLKRFFQNSTPNLFILTVISSFTISCLQTVFFFLFETSFNLSFSFLSTDLFLMSFLDGIYALLILDLPIRFFFLAKKKIKEVLSKHLNTNSTENEQNKEEKIDQTAKRKQPNLIKAKAIIKALQAKIKQLSNKP